MTEREKGLSELIGMYQNVIGERLKIEKIEKEGRGEYTVWMYYTKSPTLGRERFGIPDTSITIFMKGFERIEK